MVRYILKIRLKQLKVSIVRRDQIYIIGLTEEQDSGLYNVAKISINDNSKDLESKIL